MHMLQLSKIYFMSFTFHIDRPLYIILETSLSRKSLALVLTTQTKQKEIHQKHTKYPKCLNQQYLVHL